MNTKDRIMNTALQMFAERGYEGVSVRDICKNVGIKESTMYYHFINKQDILDALISKFEEYISGLLSHADISGAFTEGKEEKVNGLLDSCMMDSFLFDPFCNLMLRLAMIEQFHNEKLRQLYENVMFKQPYEIQKNIIGISVSEGKISEKDAEWILKIYFSYMTTLTFKYLLNGELTEERKSEYSAEVHKFYTEFANSLNNTAK